MPYIDPECEAWVVFKALRRDEPAGVAASQLLQLAPIEPGERLRE